MDSDQNGDGKNQSKRSADEGHVPPKPPKRTQSALHSPDRPISPPLVEEAYHPTSPTRPTSPKYSNNSPEFTGYHLPLSSSSKAPETPLLSTSPEQQPLNLVTAGAPTTEVLEIRPSSPLPEQGKSSTEPMPGIYEDFSSRPPSPEFVPFNYVSVHDKGDDKVETEDSEDDRERSEASGNQPVYKGHTLTLHESLVSILTFALSFAISGQCIDALLKLVNLHCLEEGNVLKPSLYFFKKYFSQIRGSVDYEFYCSKCFEKCDNKKCSSCQGNPKMCYLIKLPLLDQLQTMLRREGFASHFKAPKSPNASGLLTDVYDGKVYQEAIANMKLSDLSILLTFMYYTDGASVFSSSQISVWPLFLSINELPFSDRFLKENLLVPCLWCGPVKPHVNIMLKAIYPELAQLKQGVSFKVHGEADKTVHGIVLNGTGDTPARAVMLNMVAHNGEQCCQRCNQKGESRAGCFGVRVFPYRQAEMTPRLESSMVREGKLALLLRKPYQGWKGTTLLSNISPSPLRGAAVDPMHLIYGGISKQISKYLFGEEHSGMNYNVYKTHRSLISERLLGIKPPYYLTRLPQSTAQIATWKTSEHKSWFLYYSLPVLKGIVNDMHFRHYSSIVAGVQLLNSEGVSNNDKANAKALILKFVMFFEDLYGREYMTLTVHLLLHLWEIVEDLGPLWVFQCFDLEGINGIIMNLVHGTRFVESQIATSLMMCMGLSEIIRNLPESPAKTFCAGLVKKVKNKRSMKIKSYTAEGKIQKVTSVPPILRNALTLLNVGDKEVFTFHSLRKDKVLYVANCKTGATDSSCVSYSSDSELKVGIIETFFKFECTCSISCECEVYCLLQCLAVKGHFPTLVEGLNVPNIHEYDVQDKYVHITADKLHDVCVKMVVDNCLYVASRCNKHEKE